MRRRQLLRTVQDAGSESTIAESSTVGCGCGCGCFSSSLLPCVTAWGCPVLGSCWLIDAMTLVLKRPLFFLVCTEKWGGGTAEGRSAAAFEWRREVAAAVREGLRRLTFVMAADASQRVTGGR